MAPPEVLNAISGLAGLVQWAIRNFQPNPALGITTGKSHRPSVIIEQYIQRELLKPFAVVLTIMAGLFASFSSALFLAQAVTESLGFSGLLILVGLKTLIALEVLVPASLYIAVIIGLGRLYSDQEIIVLQASGISTNRVAVAILVVALPVSIASGILSIIVRPWAYSESYLLNAQAEAELNTDRFQAGRFYGNEESGSVIYIQSKSRGTRDMQDVFYYLDDGDSSQVVVAKGGRRIAPAGEPPELHLFDGYSYELTPSNGDESIARFNEMIYIPGGDDTTVYRLKAAPTLALADATEPREISEFQWRWSRPLDTLLLVLIAIPLSRVTPRHGKGEKSLIAALMFAVFYNLSGVARSWVEQGRVQPMPGIWWVYALMLAIGLVLFYLNRDKV